MKRAKELYEKIISVENLRKADIKAQKGKQRQFGVIEHNKNREENIQRLHILLKNGKYKTSEYFNFVIKEPKERNISRLPYIDRVVHHAVINYTGSIFTKCLIAQTYSCISGRGIHKCLSDLNKCINVGGGNSV